LKPVAQAPVGAEARWGGRASKSSGVAELGFEEKVWQAADISGITWMPRSTSMPFWAWENLVHASGNREEAEVEARNIVSRVRDLKRVDMITDCLG